MRKLGALRRVVEFSNKIEAHKAHLDSSRLKNTAVLDGELQGIRMHIGEEIMTGGQHRANRKAGRRPAAGEGADKGFI